MNVTFAMEVNIQSINNKIVKQCDFFFPYN